jgi:hypothetical protein
MTTVRNDPASAAELETPNSMDEAMETGFLPDDEHYRLTGEFKPETTEAAAASKKEKENQSEKAGASAAATEEENQDESENPGASAASSRKTAASETAQAQKEEKERGQNRENRWQKRERELKELREKVARLESKPQSEQQRSESQQTSQAAAAETKTAAKAAPKPKIDDVDEKTGKPKYANYGEYEDAKDQWLQDEAVRKFQETSAKTAQVRERSEAEKKRAESFQKKFEAPRAKYQDFDKVALNPDLLIPAGSVTDLFLDDSEHAGEVLYHLGQHPEILGDFHPARSQDEIKAGKYSNKISPQRQFRKLLEIEALVSGSGSQSAETRSGESSSEKPSSAKPVTQASRPPHQVSGKGTVAKDAVEQALDDGDFETYQRTQNAKELARLKRK